jgi:hypothetical protein
VLVRRLGASLKANQYFEGHSFLTAGAAQALKEAGAAIVGVDTYNIDDTTDMRRPAHTILLGADIPIVEHMCGMEYIADGQAFKFFAVPVKVKGFGTFPVRALRCGTQPSRPLDHVGYRVHNLTWFIGKRSTIRGGDAGEDENGFRRFQTGKHVGIHAVADLTVFECAQS